MSQFERADRIVDAAALTWAPASDIALRGRRYRNRNTGNSGVRRRPTPRQLVGWMVLTVVSLNGCSQPIQAHDPSSQPASPPPSPAISSAQQDSPTAPAAALPRLGTRQQGDDWPEFLGPTRDSHSRETGIQVDWTQPPRIVWQRELGESYGIGSTALGRFVQFDRQRDEEVVWCWEAETGKPLWDFRYPTDYRDLYGYNGGPRCSPVIDGQRVYVYGAAGMLHCLDLGTGDVLWKKDVNETYGVIQNFFGVGSTPVIENDLLLVMVGGSPPEDQAIPPGQLDRVRGNGSAIVAFDKQSGAERYRIGDELASYASLKVVSIDGQRWCLAFLRGGLLAFDPATGQKQHYFPWRARKLESVNASTPIVVGNEILISETYGPGAALLRLTPQGFEVVWSDADKGRNLSLQTHWNTPVVHDGFVYASSGRHTANAELRCVAWETGEVQWSVPGLTRCSLMLVEDYLICLGEDGVLRLLKANPQRYEELGKVIYRRDDDLARQFNLSSPLLQPPCWAAPVLSHGLLYLRGERRLVCVELIPEAATTEN